MNINLAVVDGSEIVRLGIRAAVRESEINIVGEGSTSRDAISFISQSAPDILILGSQLVTESSLELEQLLVDHPEIAVIILAGVSGAPTGRLAKIANVRATLTLRESSEELQKIIRSAASAKDSVSPFSAGELDQPAKRVNAELDTPLTNRELEVLRKLSRGMTNKEIASSLGISYETVKEHVQHVLRKIGATDRTQAAVWAVRKGLA